jgi:hypothetical protein
MAWVRRPVVPATLLLVAVACSGHTAAAPTSSPAPVVTPSTSSPTISVGPSTPAPVLPSGVPATYDQDVASGDVPLTALIPPHTTVDGSWYATLPAGDAIVVAYEAPSSDPFRAARGLVVWRRFAASPFWRATFGRAYGADENVLAIGTLVADVTGDGSPDALVMESTGGSGSCATWRVLDLAEGTQVWKTSLCDAQVVPSTDPTGLTLTEAVFKPGDAHCCPSQTRTTTLSYAGNGRWIVAARKVTPNA